MLGSLMGLVTSKNVVGGILFEVVNSEMSCDLKRRAALWMFAVEERDW